MQDWTRRSGEISSGGSWALRVEVEKLTRGKSGPTEDPSSMNQNIRSKCG